MRQHGFFFDQSRCIGCHACSIACNDKHDLPGGVHWRQVRLIERGQYPDTRLIRLSLSCLHCHQPACVDACPASAIQKGIEDGIVVVDREACLGGDACQRFCAQVCPYGAPQFGAEPNPKMQKCDLCLDWLFAGEEPACVAACPLLALESGPLEGLERRHKTILEIDGLADPSFTKPSILFRGSE